LPPHMQVLQIATGKLIAKPLALAAKLGVADLLAGGPKTTKELAKLTRTHEPSLYRLMRALASVGIFAEAGRRACAPPPASALLRDEPGSLRAMVLMFDAPFHEDAWRHLEHSVRTGKPGFDKAFGRPVFDHLSRDKKAGALFNAAMTSL